jgi:hypothetical protein
MNCSICKNEFIITQNDTEYNNEKNKYEDKVCKIMDKLTSKELNKYNNYIWYNLLLYEALLLKSGQIPIR